MKQLRGIHAALGGILTLVLAVPTVAQEASPPATATTVPAGPATSNSADTIGPAQLRGFSLNGTVTRQAAPQAAPPEPRRPAATATVIRSETRPSAVAERNVPAPRPSSAEPVRTASTTVSPAPAPLPGFDLPAQAASDGPVPASAATESLVPPALPTADPSESAAALSGGMSIMPWLIALLLLGGAVWFFGIRPRSRFATAGGMDFDAGPPPSLAPRPQPVSQPQPLQRTMAGERPVPAAPPVSSGGIVSTRLRPWLDLELVPGRAVFAETGMTIEFDLHVRNSGSAPARDVLIEAAMFNAGPDQDDKIGSFFEFPDARGDRVRQIMPMQQFTVQSAVTLPLAEMRQFDLQGRKLFVPLLAVNAIYLWSAGQGQTSLSYLIGRDGKGEKMAPLRLDQGPRLFRGLGAREHQTRIRK